MANPLDIAIRNYTESNDRVLSAARKRYARFQKLAEKARTPAQKKSAERNMEIVIVTLRTQQASFAKTMEKFKK